MVKEEIAKRTDRETEGGDYNIPFAFFILFFTKKHGDNKDIGTRMSQFMTKMLSTSWFLQYCSHF